MIDEMPNYFSKDGYLGFADFKISALTEFSGNSYFPVIAFDMKYKIFEPYVIEANLILQAQLSKQDLGCSIKIWLQISDEPFTHSGVIGKFQLQGVLDLNQEHSSSLADNSYTEGTENEAQYAQSQTGGLGDFPTKYIYKIWVYPSLWKLKFEKQFRIFQNQTRFQIVCQILAESNIIFSPLAKDEGQICQTNTQYNETTLDYITRLLQEDGIFAYFLYGLENFGQSEPTYVLQNTIIDLRRIDLQTSTGRVGQHIFEEIIDFNTQFDSSVAGYEIFDYDFKVPQTPIIGESSSMGNWMDKSQQSYSNSSYTPLSATQKAQTLLSAEQISSLRFTAISTSSSALPGLNLFFRNANLDNGNNSYFIEEAHLTLEEQDKTWVFRNIFSGVVLKDQYVPKITKKKPLVLGNQTGFVAGDAANKEINVDTFGRIKVNFHWNQTTDPTAQVPSAWLRVMQWGVAGAGWGNVCLPRVGQEVIVGFLNGDPDHPVVLGVLFNQANEFPNSMPGDAGNLTIKHTSFGSAPGADDVSDVEDRYNEISMTNTTMDEQITLRSQRDLNFQALNDWNEVVSSDKTVEVDGGEKYQNKGNRYERFGAKHILPGDVKLGTLMVANYLNDSIDMCSINKGMKIMHIESGMHAVVIDDGDVGFALEKGAFTVLAKDVKFLLYGGYSENIALDYSSTVLGISSTSVRGAHSLSVAGDSLREVSGACTDKVEGDYSLTAAAIEINGAEMNILASTLSIEAETEISIKAPAISITAASELSLAGASITLTSEAMFSVEAGATVSIKGPIVQLG
jgi:type VI secretion system VgrG family protein